jgi:hypothetical protein
MRCPQSRPATISCRQTVAMSKPSGGVAAGIGAAGIGDAGGAGERRRLNVPIIDARDQRPRPQVVAWLKHKSFLPFQPIFPLSPKSSLAGWLDGLPAGLHS